MAEVAEHDSFGRQHALNFFGRKTLLDKIKMYAACEMDNSIVKPLVLYGADGSGKTALLAKASEDFTKIFPDAWIIKRFIKCPKTPASIGGG